MLLLLDVTDVTGSSEEALSLAKIGHRWAFSLAFWRKWRMSLELSLSQRDLKTSGSGGGGKSSAKSGKKKDVELPRCHTQFALLVL
jgi:hypothetical protein